MVIDSSQEIELIEEFFYKKSNYVTLIMYKLNYYDEQNDSYFYRKLIQVKLFNLYIKLFNLIKHFKTKDIIFYYCAFHFIFKYTNEIVFIYKHLKEMFKDLEIDTDVNCNEKSKTKSKIKKTS